MDVDANDGLLSFVLVLSLLLMLLFPVSLAESLRKFKLSFESMGDENRSSSESSSDEVDVSSSSSNSLSRCRNSCSSCSWSRNCWMNLLFA